MLHYNSTERNTDDDSQPQECKHPHTTDHAHVRTLESWFIFGTPPPPLLNAVLRCCSTTDRTVQAKHDLASL